MHRSVGLPVLTGVLAAFAISAILASSAAHAETEAAQLFDRGKELRKAGNYVEACPLFERSMRLAPAPGTLLNVAECKKREGRFAEALALFERVEREATPDQQHYKNHARNAIDMLQKQIPFLTIDAAAVPGAVVELDGKPVSTGTKLAIDPGTRRIRANGARPIQYVARAGHAGSVTLEPEIKRPREVWIFGVGAAGAIALGTITGIVVIRRKNDALDNQCNADVMCQQRGIDLLNSARSLAHATTALFVVGLGAAGAAGYYEWRYRKRAVPIVIEPGPERLTVGVGGRW